MTIIVTKDDFETMCRDNAIYFRIAAGLTAITIDLNGLGQAFADYDPMGHLVGIEFLEPCSVTPQLRIGKVTANVPRPSAAFSVNGNGHKNGKRQKAAVPA